MTKDRTPFDEFLEAIGATSASLVLIPITALEGDRASLIKALWQAAVVSAPPGALDGDEDGRVLSLDDPEGPGQIVFEIATYAGKRVIEAEGVVVCHLIG